MVIRSTVDAYIPRTRRQLAVFGPVRHPCDKAATTFALTVFTIVLVEKGIMSTLCVCELM
jgi:hypothetical protein